MHVPPDTPRPSVAYIMSRWPKVSETFILNEILELRRQSVDVSLYPLLRERQPVTHPEADALTATATFLPFLSLSLMGTALYWLLRSPASLLRLLWDVLAGTFGSLNFLVGAIGILPKSLQMARLMEQRQVDHVHCHFATHPAVAGLVIHRLTGIPFSFTAHGSDLHVERRMLDLKVAEAAFVVTVSEYNRALIVAETAPQHHDRIHVVHCGVDVQRFQPTRPPTGRDPVRVLCVGTLEQVKGQRYLIDAIDRVRNAGLSVTCAFLGDGGDRRSLQAQIERLGLGGIVELLGPQPSARVVQEMDAADVVVAPSVPTAGGKREGIPVVLIEAMAMERAVVASRLSGIPELVEDAHTGLLVEPGDVEGLSAALIRLGRDVDLRVRLGHAARQTVAADFSLEGSARRLRQLIAGG